MITAQDGFLIGVGIGLTIVLVAGCINLINKMEKSEEEHG